jgi:putative DNA primase/helicase
MSERLTRDMINDAKCEELPDKQSTAHSPALKIISYGQNPPRFAIASHHAGTNDANVTIPLSDDYNSYYLVHIYGNLIRYCGEWKKWLVYQDGIWIIDHGLRVVAYAKDLAHRMLNDYRELYEEVEKETEALKTDLEKAQDDQTLNDEELDKQREEFDEREKALAKKKKWAAAYFRHANKTHGARALYNMIDLARSVEPVPVSPKELDQHHLLLPVENGVVDLESGRLLPHDPAYLFTRRIPVSYDPEATCPTWEEALYQMMGGPLGNDDPDDSAALLEERHQQAERAQRLVTFLQRSFGCALSGDITEEVVWILWGPGSNGKSVVINLLLTLFGEYGLKATQDLFMSKKTEPHPTERANLFGRRFVATSESEENRRLDAAFIKDATGREPLTARRLYENFWTFSPTHHIFMATNHVPVIRDHSHGMWRRIRLVPFAVTFHDPDTAHEDILKDPRIPKQDKELSKKLLAELPGILRWCVEGFMQWRQDGLTLPKEVRLATEDYRRDMNNVEQFVREGCQTGEHYSARAKTLYESYVHWCEYNEQHPCTQTTFGKQISALGYERTTRKGIRWYRGIAVKDIDPNSDETG